MALFQSASPLLFLIVTLISVCKCWTNVPESQQDRHLQVNISTGALQGIKVPLLGTNESYYAFLGIPYAKPPLGEFRFMPPEPPSKWVGVLDARKERSRCLQIDGGSENCLFLNVYTTKLRNDVQLLPVMVWIHGGGFAIGDSGYNSTGPEYLLQEQVIMVAMNYRLGVFGFLSTSDMSSPGNYGLKDQIQALKWVQTNIKYFGGDSTKVTIFGQSAGGASVQYLLQTSLSRNLYHRAISLSGSSLSIWAFVKEPKQNALLIGRAAGIRANNTSELIRELRKLSADDLYAASMIVTNQQVMNSYDGPSFAPTIEPPHEGAVLTRGSHETFLSGDLIKVPYITGFNTNELGGLEILGKIVMEMMYAAVREIDKNHMKIVHEAMNVQHGGPETVNKVSQEIYSYYFGDHSVMNSSKNSLYAALNDDQFIRAICETARIYSKYAPVYLYTFTYESSSGIFGNNRTFNGTCHAENLQYIFSGRMGATARNDHDAVVRRKTVKLLTNFAKTENPTPIPDALLDNVTWPLAWSSGKKSHLTILDMNEVLKVGKNPRGEAMEFWYNLYEKYGRPPYNTF